jgi:primosomal protein N' (replication factor Y)
VQSLVRWDPVGAAVRELADRTELGFPPATRLVALSGSRGAVADVLRAVGGAQVGAEVLGPVPDGEGERAYLRVPRTGSSALAQELRAVLATRSARKEETLRVQVDPPALG